MSSLCQDRSGFCSRLHRLHPLLCTVLAMPELACFSQLVVTVTRCLQPLTYAFWSSSCNISDCEFFSLANSFLANSHFSSYFFKVRSDLCFSFISSGPVFNPGIILPFSDFGGNFHLAAIALVCTVATCSRGALSLSAFE